jgi:hypothetical protein
MGTDDPIALVRHRGEEFVERVASTNAATAFPGIMSASSLAG